jgi:hypothetical protein
MFMWERRMQDCSNQFQYNCYKEEGKAAHIVNTYELLFNKLFNISSMQHQRHVAILNEHSVKIYHKSSHNKD